MLRLVEVPIVLPEDVKFNSSMGSIFHGVLMELLGSEISEQLHVISLRPYSQCVYYNKVQGTPLWRFGIIHDGLYERIMEGLEKNKKLHLKHKNCDFSLGEVKILQESSFEKIMDEAFAGEIEGNRIDIQTLTTTAFKSEGGVVNFPNTAMLYNSLLNKWNGFSAEIKLEEHELHRTLGERTKIIAYNLRTQGFSLEGRAIYGFYGTFRMSIHGNEMTRRIINSLLQFAPYTGIGMKTALGMGAVNISR